MGIPRLWQDLFPYADRLFIGASESPHNSSETGSINLIIDGPSLVYFAYNKTVAALSVNTPNDVASPPSYDEINEAVCSILDDIEDQGIFIQRIFFDGGMPKSKQKTRLSRMEKLRRELEVYKTQHPHLTSPKPPSAKCLDYVKALWDTSASSTRKSGLSPPPFMVASVIETLCSPASKWNGRALVVPGESDGFCALAARDSPHLTAILTTDSDLLIHDIGHGNVIAGLHYLEKISPESLIDKSARFRTLCFNPTTIASRLQVPSLMAFGFERCLDPGASSAVIKQRVVDSSRRQALKSEFDVFAIEFELPPSTASQMKLENLDPRTAEVVVDLDKDPEIYLTTLMEDPQRDCSWTYGAMIRRMAYTLLFETRISHRHKPTLDPAAVTEYYKRGQRIATASQIQMTSSTILLQVAEFQALHATYFPLGERHNQDSDVSIFLPWFALATHILHNEKRSMYKSLPSFTEILGLFGLQEGTYQPLKASGVSWEQIHLFANIQAVLYSIRMLWQITGFILDTAYDGSALDNSSSRRSTADANKTIQVVKQLHKILNNMQPIASMFFDLALFRFRLSQLTMERLNPTILRLKTAFESQPEDQQNDGVQGHDEASLGNRAPESSAAASAHKKRKKRKQKQKQKQKETTVKDLEDKNVFKEEDLHLYIDEK